MKSKARARQFKSWTSYRLFRSYVIRKSRYAFDDETEEFLQAVVATADMRKRNYPRGTLLWRAQLGHDWVKDRQDSVEFEIPGPLSPDRMKPLPYAAKEGRANPKGIPCLYLSTDATTAMAEVRPWAGSYISTGQFKTLKDLVLIDCSVEHGRGFLTYFREPAPSLREEAVWLPIDRSFSEPVTTNDSTADYAPTQILADHFRKHGVDGIIYGSSLGTGLNVVLFDLNTATLLNCCLFKAKAPRFEFSQESNAYFCKGAVASKKK